MGDWTHGEWNATTSTFISPKPSNFVYHSWYDNYFAPFARFHSYGVGIICGWFIKSAKMRKERFIRLEDQQVSNTVGTPNKGQLIFWENGSNKGNFGIPLFAIFTESGQIRDFSR